MELRGGVMGGQIVKLLAQHHRFLLDCRSQDRVVQSEAFINSWGLADVLQKKVALSYIRECAPVKLKYWVTDVLGRGRLGQLNMVALRQLASLHRVKNYSRMLKQELIKNIEGKGVKFDGKNRLRIIAKSYRRHAFDFDLSEDTETPNQSEEKEISN